jgi:hypothetical protein
MQQHNAKMPQAALRLSLAFRRAVPLLENLPIKADLSQARHLTTKVR